MGTTVSFSCHYGYRIVGTDSAYCRDSGMWNQDPPSCRQRNEHAILMYP